MAINTEQKTALFELQSLPQWVVWTYEMRDGRRTKVPYNALSGRLAQSNNPATWSTYQCALETLAKFDSEYNGIGFMFSGAGITGIDLDHCIDEQGQIDVWAADIIAELNSYSEKSPSGTGVHIYVHASLIEHKGTRRGVTGQRDAAAAIEMYDSKRYFTWTGNHLTGTTPETIEDRQEIALALYAKITTKQRDNSKKQSNASSSTSPDDTALLDIATKAKNGAKFAALWRGDTSDYQGDDSRADAALCALLAFYTGKDKHRIDSLFRMSGLYRENKWDSARGDSTYGWITIENAIDTCTETYSPHKRNKERLEDDLTGAYESGLPEVIMRDQSRDTLAKCLDALALANKDNPTMFMYMSIVTKIGKDEHGGAITLPLANPGLRNELSRAADFFQAIKIPNTDSVRLKNIFPPKDVAELLLALSPAEWPLLPLKALVQAPVVRPDGTILDRAGYDSATKLYYAPSHDMHRCKVPMSPTEVEAMQAVKLILSMFADFPFEGQADRANMIALLFTPFLRHAIKKHIQMALIDANNAGTGKGLLADIVSIVATGKTEKKEPNQKDDTEWKKTILAKLMTSPSIVVIDNVRGALESASLEALFTSDVYEDRVLGMSKMVSVRNEATWIATGNNLRIGGDLYRRCYRIRLISSVANPESRDDFLIADLEQWTHDNRAQIISAILTVIRAWYVAGKPLPKHVPAMGTFTPWAKTIGGILEYAGIEGFQANRAELKSENNEDSVEWENFFDTWYTLHGDTWISSGDLAKKIAAKNENEFEPSANLLFEALPQCLKEVLSEKPKTFSVSLAIQLRKRVQTVYGKDGYSLGKRLDGHRGNKEWQVLRKVAEGSTNATQGDNSGDIFTDTVNNNYHSENGQNNPPQPSASSTTDSTQDAPSDGSTGAFDGLFEDAMQNDFAEGSKSKMPDYPPETRACIPCGTWNWQVQDVSGDGLLLLWVCGTCYPEKVRAEAHV